MDIIINYTTELFRNIPFPSLLLIYNSASRHSWCQHTWKALRGDNEAQKYHPYCHHPSIIGLNCLRNEVQVHKVANTLRLKAAGTHQQSVRQAALEKQLILHRLSGLFIHFEAQQEPLRFITQSPTSFTEQVMIHESTVCSCSLKWADSFQADNSWSTIT